MAEGITVCLVVEGSYPFITGGVSAWVQELIAALPHVLFKLFTISPAANQALRYELPRNVVAHRDIVLNEKVQSRGRAAGSRAAFVEAVRAMHDAFASQSDPRLEDVVALMPRDSSLTRTRSDMRRHGR